MNNKTNYIDVTVTTSKKNNRYYAVLYYRDIYKKVHRKTIATGLTIKSGKKELKNKVEKIRLDFETELNSKKNTITTEDSSILFVDFLNHWLNISQPQIEKTTFSGYSYIIRKTCDYFKDSHLTLTNITPMDIQKFYLYLSSRNLKSTTIIRYHACIRKALACAYKMSLISKNIADCVQKPKPQQFTSAIYDLNDISILLSCITNSEYKVPITLACYYGLRREEVLGLKWSSINFDNRTITINHTVVPATINNKRVLVKKDRTKNTSSYRTLPLINEVYDLLQEEKTKQESYQKIFGNQWKNQENYICIRKDGSLIHPDTLTSNFRKIILNNHLKEIRFHDLRHSVASILLNDGNISMKKIQIWLGHSSYTTTANIYAHLDKSANEDTGNCISELLLSKHL